MGTGGCASRLVQHHSGLKTERKGKNNLFGCKHIIKFLATHEITSVSLCCGYTDTSQPFLNCPERAGFNELLLLPHKYCTQSKPESDF